MSLLVRRGRPLQRPPLVDVGIAAFFIALTWWESTTMVDDRAPWQTAFAFLGLAGLAWRRAAPVGTATLLVVADLVTDPAGRFSTVLALVVAAYTVGFEAPSPRRYIGLGVLVAAMAGALIAGPGFEPSDLAAAGVFLVGPWLVGVFTAERAQRTAEAIARADRLEREHAQRAEEAIADERARIARELHDVVAHSLTVVTIQLQSIRRRLSPVHAAEAADMAALEGVTREAMGEMRRLLGVLRGGGGGELAPQPGLEELARLVARADSEETRVTLRTEGTPADLSPGMDLALYRIAQEAVTNATRHAGARHVEVAIRWTEASVALTVTDDGRGAADTVGDGAGHGLVGMRERAALYGGHLRVTSEPGRGFVVEAVLPRAVPA